MTAPGGGHLAVTVNGEVTELEEGATVQDVVERLMGTGPSAAKGIAVALDREVVPRSSWGAVRVTQGAHIEVVTAVAGG